MSNIANEKTKKTFKMGSFNVDVKIDGETFEAVTVEGSDSRMAFERFVKWYVVFRSTYFPGLVYSDVEAIIEEIEDLEHDEVNPLMIGRHTVEIPIKDGDETTGYKTLTGTFFKRIII